MTIDTLMDLEGTETVDLITCNDAKYAKWGYAPKHNDLVVIEENYPQPSGIAIWNNQGWSTLTESSKQVFE